MAPSDFVTHPCLSFFLLPNATMKERDTFFKSSGTQEKRNMFLDFFLNAVRERMKKRHGQSSRISCRPTFFFFESARGEKKKVQRKKNRIVAIRATGKNRLFFSFLTSRKTATPLFRLQPPLRPHKKVAVLRKTQPSVVIALLGPRLLWEKIVSFFFSLWAHERYNVDASGKKRRGVCVSQRHGDQNAKVLCLRQG